MYEFRVYRRMPKSRWWRHWRTMCDENVAIKEAGIAYGHGCCDVRVVRCRSAASRSAASRITARTTPGYTVEEFNHKKEGVSA